MVRAIHLRSQGSHRIKRWQPGISASMPSNFQEFMWKICGCSASLATKKGIGNEQRATISNFEAGWRTTSSDCERTTNSGYTFSKVNPKVEPLSSVLRTFTVCLCASMICFTMESPSPVPPASLERLLSTR